MERLNEWRDRPCGCRAQKSLFRDSIGTPHTTWVVREQCEEHRLEHEDILRWFSEGGHEEDDDE